ncbi:peptidyl-tRNA hydrolase [Candidatus Microgenomates bacterium]|nr:peptidyl-tRNA hydrolase [Candidatus Microgenomates bacterium]
MKLIIGLGNPGEKYKNNRHNVGHMFVDYARRGVKTNVFMNDSGKFVKRAVSRQQIADSDLYIVHDDLDLPWGKYKIQFGVGPKVHYGIQSIENELRTGDFWRIRIGVDNRDSLNRIPGDKYVLEDFTKEEREILKGVFDAVLKDNSFPR